MISVPYTAVTLAESIYLLDTCGGYFDADRQSVILEAEDDFRGR